MSATHAYTHTLKTWPREFNAILQGKKRFEFRRNDRPIKFHIGDCLEILEYDPAWDQYTGRKLKCSVSYVLRGPEFGVPEGYAVLSINMVV